MISDIKKKKNLEWIGHPVRLDHGREVTKIFESKLDRRRRMGRPGIRCLEEVERDIRRDEC
jgi:hypothetical protein